MTKAKPIIVLAAIAALISCLVIVVYNATYKDTSNEVTDKQAAAAMDIYGGNAADYEVVPKEQWNKDDKGLLSKDVDADFADIVKVFRKKDDGALLFESQVKGYKKGFDIMVGIKDGKVAGVSIVSCGEETPGLGTKTNDPEFLKRFEGFSSEVEIVKSNPDADKNQVQGMTSATYSSRGVAKAVNIALKAYEKCKDAEFAKTSNGGGDAA